MITEERAYLTLEAAWQIVENPGDRPQNVIVMAETIVWFYNAWVDTDDLLDNARDRIEHLQNKLDTYRGPY